MKFAALSAAILAGSASVLAIANAQAQAQGPIVAVVDTGVDLTHPEFAGRMLPGACFSAVGCPVAVQTGDDDHNHGSHVAGIIAAANNGVGNTGVAPNARILPVKVLAANGSGDMTSIARGIDFARTNNARVINMSLGGSAGSTALLTALRAAKTNSVLVAAAGNQGNSFRPLWPAAYATDSQIAGSMLIVGSVDSRNVISRFSNTPSTGGCVTTSGVRRCWRDFFVVAPGENILSTGKDGNYMRMSGTSMATPYVSGVAALVLERAPYLTAAQVVDIIKKSSTDLGTRGVDSTYGWGLVNPVRAVSAVGTTRVATAGAGTTSFTGTAAMTGTSLNAAWAAPLLASNVVKSAVMFDEYGRDFVAGLAERAGPVGFNAFAMAALMPASWSVETYATGNASLQAIAADADINAVAALSPGRELETGYRHFVAQVRPSDAVTVTMGYRAPAAGVFNTLDLAAGPAQDQMFLSASALNSPYAALSDGGAFGGFTWRAGDRWQLSAAYSTARPVDDSLGWNGLTPIDAQTEGALAPRTHLRRAEGITASAAYSAGGGLSLGVTAGLTHERNGLLGSAEAGAWSLTSDAHTLSVGAQARMDLGDGWLATAAWSIGRSTMTPEANGLIREASMLMSQSYGAAVTKQGVFSEDDAVGLSVSRPLHITQGSALVSASTGVTETREIVYSHERIDLAASAPETQIELGYATSLGDAARIGLSALYQDNADGIAGKSSTGAIIRLRTEF